MNDGADAYPLHSIAGQTDPNLQLQVYNIYPEAIFQLTDWDWGVHHFTLRVSGKTGLRMRFNFWWSEAQFAVLSLTEVLTMVESKKALTRDSWKPATHGNPSSTHRPLDAAGASSPRRSARAALGGRAFFKTGYVV
jgi:hypothetical protein